MANKVGDDESGDVEEEIGKEIKRIEEKKQQAAAAGKKKEDEEEEGKGAKEEEKEEDAIPWYKREVKFGVPEEEKKLTRIKVIGIIVLIFIFIFFALQLFGIIPPLGWWGIALYVVFAFVAAFLFGKGGHFYTAIGVFILIIFLAATINWMQTTPLGQQLTGKLQVGGVQAGAGARALSGPLNVLGQIFRGEYNPETLWRSDVVKSEYQDVKDVGVKLLDAKAVRSKFYIDQIPVINGRIDAVSFPRANITVLVKAVSKSATVGSTPENWVCCIGSVCNPAKISVREARNRPFTCEMPRAENEKIEPGTYSVDVSAVAEGTATIAGKQFVFASKNALLSLPEGTDALTAFGISSDSVNSWQAGDEALNVGIGVVGDYDVLETYEPQSKQQVYYYLGVNIENPISHLGVAKVTDVRLFLPEAGPQIDIGEGDFTSLGTYDAAKDPHNIGVKNLAGVKLIEYKLNPGSMPSELKSGDRAVLLLPIKISEAQLIGQDFSTFFVLAKVNYNYENIVTVPVLVEDKP